MVGTAVKNSGLISTGFPWPNPPSWVKGNMQSRRDFLAAVPSSIRETTCRCSFQGWYYNEARHMWLCGGCEKPSPAHMGYNQICDFCEEFFTLWDFGAGDDDPIEIQKEAFRKAQAEFCRDCGGTNDARIYEEELI